MNDFFLAFALVTILALVIPETGSAEPFSSTVIWSEANLPAADSVAPSTAQLAQIFPGAHIVSTDRLAAQLADLQMHLLILPQGSVVPEAAWIAISDFLRRGGNLLVLGGRAFTRAAYRDGSGWHLREYSTRFARPMLIDQYQSTPGSEGAQFTPNPDISVELPHFAWKQAFSPVIHLSTRDLYDRGGTAGGLDVKLDTLVWGVTDGRRRSAPLMQIDHYTSGFDGGRWIFLSAELVEGFYSTPQCTILLRKLAERALEGALLFAVRPTFPLYLPGEPVELETIVHLFVKPSAAQTVRVSLYPADKPAQKHAATITLPASTTTILPAPSGKGLHIIEAQLREGTTVRAIYHSGFWIRDEEYLRSGPHLGVNSDYFTMDGKPLAIVGTTYMSSEVQRLYFDHPNVYVWNSDMSRIHSAGLNMLRTGWWTGWDKFCDETGRPYERTLRTLEAYLMTAHKYGLPVQFTFFAFLPDVLGGVNAYLDPEAVRRQQTLVSSVAARFHDVPSLAFDLINEPSFSKHLWMMRPNYDPIELVAWNDWLAKKYPDRAALAAAWNVPPESVSGIISVPTEQEFADRGVYVGVNSLRVYDFAMFAQEKFTEWVRGVREAIRATGSTQLITVGQDEGGYVDRVNPSFFASELDFTTNHTWWQNDSLLWDSLVAKQPGKAMLIQETGLQRELTPDQIARRTPEQEAALFERKMALSFVQGSGAIEWLWNSNAYMTEANETTIGALRADGTEKPEATVLQNMAKFAAAASPYLRNPQLPDVAVVTSQVAQYSVQGELQLEAQRNAVRALAYGLHQPCYIIAENQIDKLGSPKLVILPSAQALRESTWQALLNYVKNGGNLLVTGPISRDEHWHLVDRYTPLGIEAHAEPLTFHQAFIWSPANSLKQQKLPFSGFTNSVGVRVSFSQERQQLLEYLRFHDASRMAEIPVGRGKLFWSADPLELAEGAVVAEVYHETLKVIGIKSLFYFQRLAVSGILISTTELQDGVLYIFESETDTNVELAGFSDSITGTALKITVPAQRAVLALIDKRSKQIVAQYGF